MRIPRPKRGAVLITILVLLAMFAFRPGANGLRKRIVNSIGLALGRKVDVDWVKLRILPQPGFDLENFVVHDDPALSAEPILRAQEVTAVLRLRSLIRGRLEVGRLSLKEPSFNLTRAQDGHWNVESLLERAAHADAAPTRNTLPERRPLFPYIEADNGRINFKVGAEKKPYALTDADFALWLESDDQWGMRLAAQPVRTDYNLSDTGLLRVDGTWQRSLALRDTPVKFELEWNHAQLGQLTQMLYGSDKGWRGGLNISADFVGKPADLAVKVKATIDDFRHYDVVSDQSLRLMTNCDAHYSSLDRVLSNIVCRSPIGKGSLLIAGRVKAPTGPRSYDLRVSATMVPVQALVALGKQLKGNLPDDLTADGTVGAEFTLQSRSDNGLHWAGSGQTDEFVLSSPQLKTDLLLGSVPFQLDSQSTEPRLNVGPVKLTLGHASSSSLQLSASGSSYNLNIQGEAQVQRLLAAAQAVGLRTAHFAADGTAKLNLQVAGEWYGIAPPQITGTALLHSVRADIRSVSGPLNIENASLLLEPGMVRVRNINASAAGSTWTGALWFARPCKELTNCALHFDLRADTLATDKLQPWLNPASRKRPWYRLGADKSPVPLLTSLDADGQLSADRVQVHGLIATHASATVALHDGLLTLSDVSGDFLGGKHQGHWEADLSSSPPKIKASGSLDHVALEQLARAMHDGWVSGSAKGAYEVSGTGSSVHDFLSSATGTLHFDMRTGLLPHIVIPASTSALRVRRFRGDLTLRSGIFELQQARLDSDSDIYQVTGTAAPGQKLDMKLVRNGSTYVVNGTLFQPHVAPAVVTDTQASLKP